jgi:tRNA (mo5U34)-methyltransferase
MDVSSLRQRIESVSWYHELDLGNGLRTRPRVPAAHGHRLIWAFIEGQLGTIDFRGKSVLDIGCWDGRWSFYAERRGAASVLAADDRTQNWAGSEGIHIARELLGSSVQVNQHLSVYELSSLRQTFDVILFLGVYYHLFDPFHALAQIRHCCHAGSLVLIEGPVATELRPGEVLYDFADHTCEVLPHPEALRQLARAAYLEEAGRVFLDPRGPVGEPGWGWRRRLRACRDGLAGARAWAREGLGLLGLGPGRGRPRKASRRMFLTCTPFVGSNEVHVYRPPFGLHRYDDRFREPAGGRTQGSGVD